MNFEFEGQLSKLERKNSIPWMPLPLSAELSPESLSVGEEKRLIDPTSGSPSTSSSADTLGSTSHESSQPATLSSESLRTVDNMPLEDGLTALAKNMDASTSTIFQDTKAFSGYQSSEPPAFIKDISTPPNEIEPLVPKIFEPSLPPTTPVVVSKSFTKAPALRCHCHIAAPRTYDSNAPASTRLRYLLKYSETIIDCPGVYDGLSARVAMEVGFPGLYMTGAGTTASRLGAADLGIAQLSDMRANAEMIANLSPNGPPLIADMDTGYGGPIVIAKAVKEYHLAGVAGFHIEDQIMQKRCGHLSGKQVVDIDTYIQRIKACKIAVKTLKSDIVIIARTDALQSRGYAECIERLRRARDAGADMGILEGFSSKEQAMQAVKDLAPWPLTLNSVENGISPLITTQEAQAMGFRVIIFSFASIAAAFIQVKKTLQFLKENGKTGSIITPKQIFDVCGLSESIEIDEFTGGTAFKGGV